MILLFVMLMTGIVYDARGFKKKIRNTFTCIKYTLRKTEGTIENGKSRETANIGYS